MTENDTARKRANSLNDSEDGSPEPGSQSPTHTPPLTPALTPQREDTPAPENLSLRKSGSPLQTQQTLQPVDLVQPRPSPPLPSLAVSFLLVDPFTITGSHTPRGFQTREAFWQAWIIEGPIYELISR